MVAELEYRAKGIAEGISDAKDLAAAVKTLHQELAEAEGAIGADYFKSITRALEDSQKAFYQGAQAVSQYAEGFDELLKKMQAFNKEQRTMAQEAVVGGSRDGKNRAALEGLSTDELKEFIAVDDARKQNAVSVAREIVRARELEAAATKQLEADIRQLRKEVGRAGENTGRQRELREMSQLEQAYENLASVQKQLADNNKRVKGATGEAEKAALEERLRLSAQLVRAEDQVYKAEQRASLEAQRSADRQAAAAKKTADAKINESRRAAREQERASEKERTNALRAERTAQAEAKQLASATMGRDAALQDAGYAKQAREGNEYAAVVRRLADNEQALLRVRAQLARTDLSRTDRAALLRNETQLIRQQTAALQEQNRIQEESSRELENHRFALYEVATAYGVMSAAIIGAGVGAAKAYAEFESGMTSVERTSGLIGEGFTGELQELEGQLVAMSDRIPTVTGDILDMAARAGQLGVASDEIAGFTDTISKFVAISDTVDANSAAEAFGRIANLTGNRDWEELASMVALVGVNSAATDQQILKTAQEISQAGAAANYSSDQIIGLAGAFASLGVPPERARSVMQDLNKVMNKSLAGMNDGLAQAADLMGITADEAANLWQTDSGAFFEQFVQGLSGVDNLTVALSNIGLEGARAQPVFAALTKDYIRNAEGASVLAKALSDAESQIGSSTELSKQYAPLLDDLNARWTMLSNTFGTTAAAIGGELAPILGGMMMQLQQLLIGIRDFVSTPVGGMVAEWALRIAVVGAALVALRGTLMLATAWVGAFTAAQRAIGGAGVIGQIRMLLTAMGLIPATAAGATTATWSLRTALLALGRATLIIGILQLVMELLFNFSGVARGAGDVLIWLADTFQGAANVIASALQAIGGAVAGLGRMLGLPAQVMDQLDSLNDKFGLGGSGLKQYASQLHAWADSMDAAKQESYQTGSGVGALSELYEELDESAGDAASANEDAAGGIEEAGDAAEEAAPKIRTLIDYASELSQVWSRAFEIRFSGGQSMDAITSTFQRITKETRDSARAIQDLQDRLRSLRADLSGLQSELGIQQYFLGIALEYGDTDRATAIQANIAKLQADIAAKQTETTKTTEDLSAAEALHSKTLTGNSEAAIKNRSDILALVTAYQAHLEALAKSGLGADELAAATQALKQDFMAQASQLGYNSSELGVYAAAFDDVAFAIANIPRNVDIDVNVNPALTALEELRASLQDTLDAASGLNDSLGGGGDFPVYPTVNGGGGGGGKSKPKQLYRVPKPTYMPQNTAPENNPVKPKGSGATGNPLEDLGLVELWDGFKGWFNDVITADINGIGADAGSGLATSLTTSLSQGLNNSVIDTPTFVNTKIVTPIRNQEPILRSVGDTLGKAVGGGINAAPYDAAPIASRISSSLAAQGPILRGAGTAAGNAVSGGLSSASYGNVGAQVANAVNSSIYANLGAMHNAGYAAGQAVGQGTRAGIAEYLRNNPLRPRPAAISRPGSMPTIDFGWAKGGYTGRGAKYEEAGTVHRGEYVVPKEDVNQNTGLPYADALGRLQRGSQPSGGYARGGYVDRGGAGGVVDLSAGSIHAIARAVEPYIFLDGKVVAESSSRQYANSTKKGAS